MAKKLTTDELKKLVSEAIKGVQDFFQTLIITPSDKNYKKASLISYWIKDYIRFLKKEETFDPKTLLKYKRGSIIQAEFGFRLGNELGGRHYAVVIDNKNAMSSGIVTVVPLTSLKSNYSVKKNTFILSKGIYKLCEEKVDAEIQQMKAETNAIGEESKQKLLDFTDGKISLEEYKKYETDKNKKIKKLNVQIALSSRNIKLLDKLKLGTVVDAGQVITISKLRIINPCKKTDSLTGIKLIEADLHTLNSYLKKLYNISE